MISNKKYSLILGSQSPRRKELLGWLGIPFEICPTNIEEITEKTIPLEVAEDLAALKGRAVLDKLKERLETDKDFFPFVISSDTIVTLDNKIYGKPNGVDGAREMLKELSGKTHTVITSVFIGFKNFQGELIEDIFSCQTDVTFASIDEDVLEHYLISGESLDKAGSYGIQGQGLVFISDLRGSYSNVVGFPLDMFHNRLKRVLGHQNDNEGKWRELFQS